MSEFQRPRSKGLKDSIFRIRPIGLITFTVSALWQCALYQVKAEYLPSRKIPNILIYYGRLFGNIAV